MIPLGETDSVIIHRCAFCGKVYIRSKYMKCEKNHKSCCHCGEQEITEKEFKTIILLIRRFADVF